MSQAYHKENVHIGHVVIDGVIDSPATHAWGAKVFRCSGRDVSLHLTSFVVVTG